MSTQQARPSPQARAVLRVRRSRLVNRPEVPVPDRRGLRPGALDGHRAPHQGPGHLPQAGRPRPGPGGDSKPPATAPRQTFPHWLAKAFADDAEHTPFVDLIYRSGNGVAEVDDEWFEHAIDAEVLGIPVKLIPAEENLWSKAFVMERERFDGADVAHLIQRTGRDLDWDRLLRRFGPHWRVPHGPPRPLRLHLPVRARPDPRPSPPRAADRLRSGDRRPAPGRPGLPGHAPLPRAVPDRYRAPGIGGRSRSSPAVR